MNALTPVSEASLPSLVRTAATKLAQAESSAEVLEAREMAGAAYDAAKRAGRLARAKAAHDEIISTVYRAQADALEIESLAKRRLADEYDAAQDRGEVRKAGNINSSEREELAGVADLGLSHKDIHEARQIRDAEIADPGVTRRTLDRLVDNGQEPTKAALKREIIAKPEPRVSDDALWLWGRLRDFEAKNILHTDPPNLLAGMTDAMRADVCRLVPLVREFLEEMEVACEPA